jgi:hypothetical protein
MTPTVVALPATVLGSHVLRSADRGPAVWHLSLPGGLAADAATPAGGMR